MTRTWFIKPFWFGVGRFPRGVVACVGVYPWPYQLMFALVWPSYLPLLFAKLARIMP